VTLSTHPLGGGIDWFFSSQALESLLTVVLFSSIAIWWVAAKWLTVLWDRPLWWDAVDVAIAVVGAGVIGAAQLATLSFDSFAQSRQPIELLVLSRSASVALALFLSGWVASIWIETESGYPVPESLESIATRAHRVHLGWFPGVNVGDE